VLDAAESRHLTKALRARPGDAVTLFDGRGAAWLGVMETTGREAMVRVASAIDVRSPAPAITLAMALLKGKAMDAVVKAAVEIGVTRLTPLVTEHTEVRLDAARAASKVAHWEAVAIEAMKQSGNLAGMALDSPAPLADWLTGAEGAEVRLVASLEPGAVPILRALSPPTGDVCVLIGPEGDFSPGEYRAIGGAGFTPVSLAEHVLRAETAGVYALSAAHAALRALQ